MVTVLEHDSFRPIVERMKFCVTTLSAYSKFIEIQLVVRCRTAQRDGEEVQTRVGINDRHHV